MYQDYIKEYKSNVKKYENVVKKASLSNIKRIKAIATIYLIPLAISFILPDPLFKLPLLWPLVSLASSSLLSVPFFRAYKQTTDIINGANNKINTLNNDIAKMEEHDKKHTITSVKKRDDIKYAYDKNKKRDTGSNLDTKQQNCHGRR